MPEPRLLLCADAGQTGVRVAVREGERELARVDFPGVRSDVDIVDQLIERTAQVLASFPGRDSTVAIGASGLRLDADPRRFLALAGVVSVHLAHDSVTGFLSVLGHDHGVVLAVGTGTVVLGVGPKRVARVDGWGHLLGDAGSGFWIGREALAAVLRAHDGRGPATALADLVQVQHPDLDVLYMDVQTDPHRVSTVASWARVVADLARTDDIAQDILRRAASELVKSAKAALDRAELADQTEPRIGLVGKVFNGETLSNFFTAGIADAIEGAKLFRADSDGLVGASLLPEVTLGSALDAHIIRAER